MAKSSLSVEIKGLEQLQRKFDMSSKRVQREAREAMKKSVVVVHDRAGTYPRQRPTNYVRTGNLGRFFAHRVESFRGGVRGYVTNPIPYAPYVRGTEMQASVHRGYWATMKQIVQQKQGQIEGFFADALKALARFLGD